MEKYKIEKNSVQETLVIPLYGRWLCSQRFTVALLPAVPRTLSG